MSEEIKKDDKVFIGEKPLGAYLKGIEVQASKNKSVIIGARGKFISKLVSVAEISKRNGYKVESIKIDSEPFKDQAGKDIFVSSMEIILAK